MDRVTRSIRKKGKTNVNVWKQYKDGKKEGKREGIGKGKEMEGLDRVTGSIRKKRGEEC